MTADTRIPPPPFGDERTMLGGFLDRQRQTLAHKCAGLAPAQLATRTVDPSAMSLLGLVRHLTENERGWFGEVLATEDVPPLYGDGDGDITVWTRPRSTMRRSRTCSRRGVRRAPDRGRC